MFKGLLSYIESMNTKGLHWPFLYDPTTNKPSVTLMFMYVTFALALGSVIALHFFPSLMSASIVSIAFWVLSVVFYRMRRLDDVNFNLKTGSVEIKGDDKKEGDD